VTADREALERALVVEDQTERLLEVAAVVSDALAEIGIHPVVVGGLAVAYWTSGAYLTGDIDVVMPSTPAVYERLAALGFERRGRFWTLPGRDVFLEAPGSALRPGEQAEDIELSSGGRLRLERPEDVLVNRLHELAATPNSDVFRSTAYLRRATRLDPQRLTTRVAEERLESTLAALDHLVERLERGESIQPWEIAEAVRGLR
jgi:hypothetical protein